MLEWMSRCIGMFGVTRCTGMFGVMRCTGMFGVSRCRQHRDGLFMVRMALSHPCILPLHLHQVLGLGPKFQLKITVQNTGSKSIMGLIMTYHYNAAVYQLSQPLQPLPALLPQQVSPPARSQSGLSAYAANIDGSLSQPA